MDSLFCRSPEEYAEKFVDAVVLGYRLRNARLRLGYSQEEVAHCLNVSRRTVSAWELGERGIDVITYARLCEVLELEMYDALVKEIGLMIQGEVSIA